ncbi:MAG: S9 family peptidase [Chloroflexi bacterium]|nr:S9 family peptidase [Chloroflexota bacterium]OJV86855.1 MAG: hypothetical protein BGO39_13595 [Chloroflexi bacterium 54-19]
MPSLRTFSLDDLFALDVVADPQVSPDGTQVAFTVTKSYSEPGFKTAAASIWLVPFDGSAAPRKISAGNHADHTPRWSPDGKTLAFLSDRDKADVAQLYTLPVGATGESKRLTSAKGGVTSLKWSPNGTTIGYLAVDGTDEAEDERIKVRDDAEYYDHNYKYSRLWTIDAEGAGEPKLITTEDYQVQGFAYYAGSWAVLTSRAPVLNESHGWNILAFDKDGKSEKLTQIKYATSGLKGSPDGKSLAWINNGTEFQESANELWAIYQGGAPKVVTQDYAGGIYWTDWLDNNNLLVIAVDSTLTRLGKVAASGGEVEEIKLPRIPAEVNSWSFQATASQDGRHVATVLEDGTHPGDVWAIDLDGETAQISHCNAFLSEVSLGQTESISWKAPDGRDIEGVLIYPSGYEEGKRYPLVVDVHGGPTWYWLDRFMANWHDWGQWLAANGYAVLLANPRGSAGRGRDFSWTNKQNWGIGDFDDFLSGVDALIERGLVDPDRMGIGGWSYGGYMTSWAVGHTDRFKAAIVGAGVTNLFSFQAADISNWLPTQQFLTTPYVNPEIFLRSSPITYVTKVTTPTLLLHGGSDERVRLGQGREFYNALRILGKTVEMVVYPREPHTIKEMHHQRDLLTRVAGWFNKYLKPEN